MTTPNDRGICGAQAPALSPDGPTTHCTLLSGHLGWHGHDVTTWSADVPELPAWLIQAAAALPAGQRGVALGFAAAGYVAGRSDR